MTALVADRARWQRVLLGPEVRRSEVNRLGPAPWPLTPRIVRVIRNHTIEPVEPVIRAAAAYAGFDVELAPGAYSDALDADGVRSTDSAVLFWVDASRYQSDLGELLSARIEQVRRASSAPIAVVLADPPTECSSAVPTEADLPDVLLISLSDLLGTAEWWRSAMIGPTGSGLTPRAAGLVGRTVGGVALPALFGARIKAIMVDLDNTLHAGVLGEDGLEGVKLTPAARRLQEQLKQLSASGVVLCAVSKNDPGDVENLLAQHPDYLLRRDDFFGVRANWGEKSASMDDLIAELRIGRDAVLFLDDNPGELLSAELSLEGIRTMLVDLDGHPDIELANYPGLRRYSADTAAAQRLGDLRANAERTTMQNASDDEFFAALGVEATVLVDVHEEFERVADLLAKTNQFNSSIARTGLAEVRRLASEPDGSVVAVHLRDRFSESGVISAMLLRRVGTTLRVLELCISCRALGRRLENTIVHESLRSSGLLDGAVSIEFELTEGPRNEPARAWLAAEAQIEGRLPTQTVTLAVADILRFERPVGVELNVVRSTNEHS